MNYKIKKSWKESEDGKEKRGKLYHEYYFKKQDWIICLAGSGIITYILNELFYKINALYLGGFFIFVVFVRVYRQTKVKEQRKKLNHEFCDALEAFSVALQAGYSAENALHAAREDLEKIYGKDSILVQEFLAMEHQMGLNIPLERMFWDLAERSGLEDLQNFAAVFESAKRNGGNMEQIIKKTANMIGEKIDVYKEIETILAAKKSEHLIMSLMPCAIIIYLNLTSPGLLDMLYGNMIGVFIMTVCLSIYVFAWWLGNKIVEIQV